MRLTLVQPPNGLFDRYDLAPPLGLLTLAAAAEADGVDVLVVDMNLRGILDHRWVEEDFYEHAVAAVAETDPDVVGFTSMAVESHVGLEIARRLKALDRGLVTLFGGPHFSSIACEMLELFPWVDYVVTGEGEAATLALLRHLQGRRVSLPNVARRTVSGVSLDRQLKNPDGLDELPFPAYHLVDLPSYLEANPLRLLDYEHGRGCIFKCAFCYSPVHWGQGEQVKAVDRIVEEVARLYDMGGRHLFFVQDNFPNSKPLAKAICHALTAADTGMSWNCYATLPHLLPDFLDDLAAAGCTAIFVGVDAITTSSQKAFGKPFFRGWEKLQERLQGCLDRGMVPTCAFMVDTPQGDHADTDATLSTALFAKNLGCGIRLNTLTLYNDTVSERELRGTRRTYTNLKPSLLLDTPRVLQDNPYAREHPELFPFHNTYLPLPLYRRFVIGMHTAYTLFTSFPRTLLQYALADGGSLWGLFDRMASRLGDLTEVDPVLRRPLERELFLEHFPRLSLSSPTRSALELETAELRLGKNGPASAVPVRVEGQVLPCREGQFQVVRLPYPPQALDRVGRLPEAEGPARPYLLVREDRQIQFFEVDEEIVPTLTRLDGTRPQEAVELTPELLDELLAAGVLHGPEPTRERRATA